MIVIDSETVVRTLTLAERLDLARRAFLAISDGKAHQPLRSLMKLPKGGFGMMPGQLDDPPSHGIKLISLFPDAAARGLSSHQGVMVLFDGETGTPLAVIEAGSLTALRTAAASAVATDLLARPEAVTLALFGYGEQAEAHLEALRAVRPLARAAVWGPSVERARAFCERHAADGLELVPCAGPEEAVAGADIVATCTSASEPVLLGRWLEPGQHVVAMGASVARFREIDDEVLSRSRIWVDWREGAEHDAGELVRARETGLAIDIVGEVGAALAGRIEGRRHPHEITLFRSLGVAAEDLVFANAILAKANGRPG